MIERRSFLKGLLFVAAAPAIVRVDSLMRLPPPRILRPDGYGEGLVMELYDLQGNLLQALPAFRHYGGTIECIPTRWANNVHSYRLRQGSETKFHYFLGAGVVSPNSRLHFGDPDGSDHPQAHWLRRPDRLA